MVAYSKLKIQISPTRQLKLVLSIEITYNYSLNAVTLNITAQDIKDYLNNIKEN
ncbi:DUF787 family protein [Borrelia persica]|uniref:DUF787 family protein n=1 Tax=Borrelia persica TaxID=44448 RepID=UPI00228342F1|nr:DUF787 family protein [Borrelia persica]